MENQRGFFVFKNEIEDKMKKIHKGYEELKMLINECISISYGIEGQIKREKECEELIENKKKEIKKEEEDLSNFLYNAKGKVAEYEKESQKLTNNVQKICEILKLEKEEWSLRMIALTNEEEEITVGGEIL